MIFEETKRLPFRHGDFSDIAKERSLLELEGWRMNGIMITGNLSVMIFKRQISGVSKLLDSISARKEINR